MVPNDVVAVADIMTKVEKFLQVYRPSLNLLREKQPEEWNKQIEASKKEALKDSETQAVVEMLALCTIEYECCLRDGSISPLVKNLKEYAEMNHIKMG